MAVSLMFISVLVTSTTMATTVASTSCSDSNLDVCNSSQYCDVFHGACRPCQDICSHETGSFEDCQLKCEDYLKSQIFNPAIQHPISTDDLRTIQILLAVITGVCFVILVLLIGLIVCKVKGRRRRRIQNSKETEVVPLGVIQSNSSLHMRTASPTHVNQHLPLANNASLELPRFSSSGSNGVYTKSVRTLNTHLSDLEAGSSSSGSRRRMGPRSPPQGMIPTEDSVLPPPVPTLAGEQGAYDNPGLIASPTASSGEKNFSSMTPNMGHLPPINKNVGGGGQSNGRGPFTISHSQVI